MRLELLTVFLWRMLCDVSDAWKMSFVRVVRACFLACLPLTPTLMVLQCGMVQYFDKKNSMHAFAARVEIINFGSRNMKWSSDFTKEKVMLIKIRWCPWSGNCNKKVLVTILPARKYHDDCDGKERCVFTISTQMLPIRVPVGHACTRLQTMIHTERLHGVEIPCERAWSIYISQANMLRRCLRQATIPQSAVVRCFAPEGVAAR
jgi:hypothetical protein